MAVSSKLLMPTIFRVNSTFVMSEEEELALLKEFCTEADEAQEAAQQHRDVELAKEGLESREEELEVEVEVEVEAAVDSAVLEVPLQGMALLDTDELDADTLELLSRAMGAETHATQGELEEEDSEDGDLEDDVVEDVVEVVKRCSKEDEQF